MTREKLGGRSMSVPRDKLGSSARTGGIESRILRFNRKVLDRFIEVLIYSIYCRIFDRVYKEA